MMLHKRPPRPEGFDTKVAAEIARLRAERALGQEPNVTKPIWQDFKAAFSAAQHGRCGYCELPVVAGQHGDVEHFAPKSAVMEFGDWEAERGRETDDLAKLTGRSPSRKWKLGYWWLAYDWNNYLLACSVCNSVWKGNLYPVKQPPLRGEPDEANQETPMLLNPFGRRDPARHLRFTIDGSVEPLNRSVFGQETIRTCGLSRLALVQFRSWSTTWAYGAVLQTRKELAAGVLPEDSEGLADLHRLGRLGAPFPGAVRAIISQELRPLTWELLDDLFGEAVAPADVRRREPA